MDGKTMQDELVTYGLERTIYRLSISKYAERFTLKGGIFLYALFDGNFARVTMDIDLLAQQMSNDTEEI
ncbi:MAG: nucleotidyl transferase AbiEii/AbiGii toxin family protein [Suilimivivens sp.]